MFRKSMKSISIMFKYAPGLTVIILIFALLTACAAPPSFETSDTPEVTPSETMGSSPTASTQTPSQTPSPSLTETPTATPTLSVPTYEKAELSGTWKAALFGDRGHALLIINEISKDKLELEFFFYEYIIFYDDIKTIKISQISAVAEKQGNAHIFTTTYIENINDVTEMKGQISLERGLLSVRYDEITLESSHDVQLLSEAGETFLRYDHADYERHLPAIFIGVRDEESSESLHSYPLFNREVGLPFTKLDSPDEVVKILGEPLETIKSENSSYGTKTNHFTFKYENMEVEVWQLFMEDGSSKYALSSLVSTDNYCIPSARDIKIGDSVDDVLSRFLCEQGDYHKLLTPSGRNKQSTLYGFAANSHDFGEIMYEDGKVSVIRLVVGTEILSYFIDKAGIVYQIGYRCLY